MRRLFSELPEACDNTLWIAERAEVELELGKAGASRSSRFPRGLERDTYEQSAADYLAPSHLRGGRGTATVRRCRRRSRERLDFELRVISEMGFCGLLPRRLGPHPLRPGGGHPGRARDGVGGRVLCRLLPAHRRSRPDPLRPALRALLEPRPQADARHRHGLRRALPRRDDPLRRGALRMPTTSPRSSPSRRSRRGPPYATVLGCSAFPTPSATGSRRPCPRS